MTRPTLIDLNPIELKYYPFMISLHKYKETCHTVDNLYTKIWIPSKTKDVDVM